MVALLNPSVILRDFFWASNCFFYFREEFHWGTVLWATLVSDMVGGVATYQLLPASWLCFGSGLFKHMALALSLLKNMIWKFIIHDHMYMSFTNQWWILGHQVSIFTLSTNIFLLLDFLFSKKMEMLVVLSYLNHWYRVFQNYKGFFSSLMFNL